MCDPVTVGYGLAALAGGTYLQQDARADRQEAMEEAASDIFNIEDTRQQGYDKERVNITKGAIDKTAGREVVEAQAAKEIEKRLASQQANTPARVAEDGYTSPAVGAETRNVQSRLESKQTKADAELKQKFGALAKLRSLGDTLQSFGIQRRPMVDKVAAVGSFARQSGDVAPLEARAAALKKQNKGSGQELLGSLAAAFGSMMLGQGAMGGVPAGGGPAVGAVPTEASSLFMDPTLYNQPMTSFQRASFYA